MSFSRYGCLKLADASCCCVALQLDVQYDSFIRTTDAQHEVRICWIMVQGRNSPVNTTVVQSHPPTMPERCTL